MPKVKVRGQLTDFGLDPMTANNPVLVFTHVRPGISVAGVLTTKPVEVKPTAGGYFEAELVPSAAISPDGYYTMAVRWVELPSKLRRTEKLPWQLRVSAEGGNLTDMLRVPSNPGLVWTGAEPPANPSPGTWWMDLDGKISEKNAGPGWTFKQNIRGPAGYNALGADASQRSVADWINETAGPNPVAAALNAGYVTAVVDAAGDVTLYQNGKEL